MTGRVGLVVAGAGARGAYEAGALAGLLPRMAARGHTPTIFVGTSAGALNVVGLGGMAHLDEREATERLMQTWGSIRLSDVFGLASGINSGLRYLGQLAGLPTPFPSLLDTKRLRAKLSRILPMDKLHENISDGRMDAVAVVTTSVATGGTVVFLEKNSSVPMPPDDVGRNITYVETQLSVEHVLASAAVPILFRSVLVTEPRRWRGWYIDGGLRLNTPLKPALDLGCDRLGIVATMPMTSATSPPPMRHWFEDPTQPTGGGPPDVYYVAALVLRVLLADRMIEEIHRIGHSNELARESDGFSPAAIQFAGPSTAQRADIAALANEVFRTRLSGVGAVSNPSLWLLDRLIGGDAPVHGSLLSYLYFDSAFTSAAAALGLEHSRSSNR